MFVIWMIFNWLCVYIEVFLSFSLSVFTLVCFTPLWYLIYFVVVYVCRLERFWISLTVIFPLCAFVATYNKNNPELFSEIMKNLEELKNKDKNKEILDTTKIIKSQRQPKNLKRILTSSTFGENTTQGVAKCNNKWYKICDIIIEGKSYTF